MSGTLIRQGLSQEQLNELTVVLIQLGLQLGHLLFHLLHVRQIGRIQIKTLEDLNAIVDHTLIRIK